MRVPSSRSALICPRASAEPTWTKYMVQPYSRPNPATVLIAFASDVGGRLSDQAESPSSPFCRAVLIPQPHIS